MEMEIEKSKNFEAPDKGDFLEILKQLKNSQYKYRTNLNLEDQS